MTIELDGEQRRLLRKILSGVFTRVGLEQLASDYLPERYDNLVRQGNLESEAFDLIEECRRRGWTDRLLRGVIAERPDDERAKKLGELSALRNGLGLTSADAKRSVLEKLVGPNRAFFDVEIWRARLAEQEWRVCQVRKDDCPIGTGFLVGPDAILTNHHVMREAIETPARASAFSVCFDYRRTTKGDVLYAGTPITLANDWLIACEPHSPVDLETDPKSGAPKDDELDFALIRLSTSIGRDAPFGAATASARGWIAIDAAIYPFADRPGLAILQHPNGEPLKLALDPGCKATLSAQNRIRYDLPTMPGSSGSPIYDAETFKLVALHHGGDPGWAGKYNEGIPISAIAAHPGVRAYLGDLE